MHFNEPAELKIVFNIIANETLLFYVAYFFREFNNEFATRPSSLFKKKLTCSRKRTVKRNVLYTVLYRYFQKFSLTFINKDNFHVAYIMQKARMLCSPKIPPFICIHPIFGDSVPINLTEDSTLCIGYGAGSSEPEQEDADSTLK